MKIFQAQLDEEMSNKVDDFLSRVAQVACSPKFAGRDRNWANRVILPALLRLACELDPETVLLAANPGLEPTPDPSDIFLKPERKPERSAPERTRLRKP